MIRNNWKLTLAVAVGLAVSLSATAVRASIIAYWKFDTGAGPTPNEVAFGDATPVNSAGYDADTPDGGGFSASTAAAVAPFDWFAVGDVAYLDGANQFTISAWVNPSNIITAATRHLVVTKDQSYEFGFENGGFTLRINNGARNISTGLVTGVLPDGNWHHIAVVYNNPAVNYYLDGVLFEAVFNPDNSFPNDVAQSLGFGNRPDEPNPVDQSDLQFFGLFDEISLWDNPLTPEELARLAVPGTDARALIIPEPSALLLAAFAALLLLGRTRRVCPRRLPARWDVY